MGAASTIMIMNSQTSNYSNSSPEGAALLAAAIIGLWIFFGILNE